MSEVYAVEAVLALKSNVLEQVGKMIAEFEKLGELIRRTGLTFNEIGNRIQVATVASERMAKAQAAIAAESSKTAANYRRIAEASEVSALRPSGSASRHGGSGMVPGVIAAAGMFTAFHAVKTEIDNQRELAKFRNDKSLTDADSVALRAKAEEMTRAAPGTTIHDNLAILLDTFTVIRDVSKSMAVGVDLAKVQAARNMMDGKQGGSYSAVKFAETLQMIYGPDHQVSADEMRNVILREQKVETAFAGRVTPDMMLAFAKQARTSGMMVDPNFIFEDLPAIIQAIGGPRTGTGLAAFARQFVGGTMTKVKFQDLQKGGFIDKSAVWDHGHVPNMDKHLIGGAEASRNPETWVTQFLIPQLKKNGIDVNDKNAVAKWITSHGSTNTSAGFLAELVIGRENITKDRDAIRDKTTDDPLGALSKNAPATAALLSFNSALNEFLSTLGKELVPQATSALQTLTTGLNGITDWMKKNPQAGHDLTVLGEYTITFLGIVAGRRILGFAANLVKLGAAVTPFVEGGAVAGGLASIASGLSALVAPIVAIMAVLKLGSDHETPETQKRREDLRKGLGHGLSPSLLAPQDGYGVDGRPIPKAAHEGGDVHKESYVPPNDNQPRIQTVTYIQLDGKTIAKAVSDEQTHAMSLPASGSTRFDGRQTAIFPGTTMRA